MGRCRSRLELSVPPCSVQARTAGPPLPLLTAVNSTSAVLSSKGREEMALQGVASFDNLQLKGTINQSYDLQVGWLAGCR